MAMRINDYRTGYVPTAHVHEHVSYNNNKPYRTKAQKKQAKRLAVLNTEGRYKGTYTSIAPLSYHPTKAELDGKKLDAHQRNEYRTRAPLALTSNRV